MIAVEIGRGVYDKVVTYVRYQMTQLLTLVLLFLARHRAPRPAGRLARRRIWRTRLP